MNKRLVWNFEINTDLPLDLPEPIGNMPTNYHWEARFFWNENAIIRLHGLSDTFLSLSNYTLKHRKDTYYLLPHADYNLKERKGTIFYKPLLFRTPHIIAYGKKIALHHEDTTQLLPGENTFTKNELLKEIQTHSVPVTVEKEALIYKLQTNPLLKFELARLMIDKKVYFSLSIESRACMLIESVLKQLLDTTQTSDYVTFLKSTRRST